MQSRALRLPLFDMFGPSSAAAAANMQLSCESASFLLFLPGLRVSPSWWIPQLSLRSAVLWHFIRAGRKKAPEVCKERNSRWELRTQHSCQQLQGYLFIWRCEMTAAMSLSAHIIPWHENRDIFVTCSLFCEKLCREKAGLAASLCLLRWWFFQPFCVFRGLFKQVNKLLGLYILVCILMCLLEIHLNVTSVRLGALQMAVSVFQSGRSVGKPPWSSSLLSAHVPFNFMAT